MLSRKIDLSGRLRALPICLLISALFGCGSESTVQPAAAPGWVSQQSGTRAQLWGVHFVDASTGTVVGIDGTILRTVDGGLNWQAQDSGTRSDLVGVYFTDSNTGTVVGGDFTSIVILHTTDGGATWNEQLREEVAQIYLRSVSFADAQNGFAVGDFGTIRHTSDGGATWTAQRTDSYPALLGVFCIDANTATAVGNSSAIFHTVDGGATWLQQTVPGSPVMLFDVHFADRNTGTVVGRSGRILHTTDSGANWTLQDSGLLTDFRSVSFVGTDVGVVVGGIRILRTTDGGVRWARQSGDSAGYFGYFGVWFADADHGTVVGDDGTILHTTTGGR